MKDNTKLKLGYFALLAVTIVALTVLVAIGKNGPVSNGLLAVTAATGGLSIWQTIANKPKE